MELDLTNSAQRNNHYVGSKFEVGTGGLMVKTSALDLVSQGSSPTCVRVFFLSFPLFNLNALEFTQLYLIK